MTLTLLSPHFSLEELTWSTTASRLGLDNSPQPWQRQNLEALAQEQLEQSRALLGPLHVDSGLRQPQVNAAVGGAKTSQHQLGLAADIVPEAVRTGQMTMQQAYETILNSSIPYDQLIAEFFWPGQPGGWIHISRASAGKAIRHQALMINSHTGRRYLPYSSAFFTAAEVA